MLGEGHELHVGVAGLVQVVDELVREIAVAETGSPGSEVHLIHAHGGVVRVFRRALGQPCVIRPLVEGLADLRRGGRRNLGVAGHRVGAGHPVAGRRAQLELVGVTRGEAGDEQLPYAIVVEPAHRVEHAVPVVEVADDASGGGVRRPDREGGALDVLVRPVVRAEDLPQLLVAALAPQEQVDLADGRHEPVGVVGGPVGCTVVGRGERVRLAVTRQEAVPQPVGRVAEGDGGAVGAQRGDGLRERAHRAHDEAALHRVLPERAVGLRMPPLDERGDVIGVQVRQRGLLHGRLARAGWRFRRGLGRFLGCHQAGPFVRFTLRMCTGSTKASSRT